MEDESKIAYVHSTEGTYDLRGVNHYWNCPNCKRGKNQMIDTIYIFNSRYVSCECCCEEAIVISQNSLEHPDNKPTEESGEKKSKKKTK